MKKLHYLFVFAVIALLFSSCKKEDISLTLNETSITLYPDEQKQISPNMNGCLFESEFPAIASVSSSGQITALLVGTTKIKVTNGSQEVFCDVTVKPRYQMYKEPYLGFGSSKLTVKANETRTLNQEDDESLLYKGENSYIDNVLYVFDKTGMSSVGCLIPTRYASMLGDYLVERYMPINVDLDIYRAYFLSPDLKTAIGMQVYSTSYIIVLYIKAPDSKVINLDYHNILYKIQKIFQSIGQEKYN